MTITVYIYIVLEEQKCTSFCKFLFLCTSKQSVYYYDCQHTIQFDVIYISSLVLFSKRIKK